MPASDSENLAIVKEYFRRSDTRQADLFDLLDDDIQFYFPKYGIGRGKRQFARFGAVLGRSMEVYHDQGTLRFVESGDVIVVEGTTYGQDASGKTWRGGRTPGGRFCSVFELHGGRIIRHYIYADPDYPSHHEDGFLWGKDRHW
jgi:ketosteroid isomerase-like protein